jgi:hypothetical protein
MLAGGFPLHPHPALGASRFRGGPLHECPFERGDEVYARDDLAAQTVVIGDEEIALGISGTG